MPIFHCPWIVFPNFQVLSEFGQLRPFVPTQSPCRQFQGVGGTLHSAYFLGFAADGITNLSPAAFLPDKLKVKRYIMPNHVFDALWLHFQLFKNTLYAETLRIRCLLINFIDEERFWMNIDPEAIRLDVAAMAFQLLKILIANLPGNL